MENKKNYLEPPIKAHKDPVPYYVQLALDLAPFGRAVLEGMSADEVRRELEPANCLAVVAAEADVCRYWRITPQQRIEQLNAVLAVHEAMSASRGGAQ